MKAQQVRLIDVLVLGPLMWHVAERYPIPEPARSFLLVSGVATILYNGFNYVEQSRMGDNSPAP